MPVSGYDAENDGSSDKKDSEQLTLPSAMGRDRRSVCKLAAGGVVLAGCSILPAGWTTPLVQFGLLPAHAITTGECPAPDGSCGDQELPDCDDSPEFPDCDDSPDLPDCDDSPEFPDCDDSPEFPDCDDDSELPDCDELPAEPALPAEPEWPLEPDFPDDGLDNDEVQGNYNSVTVSNSGDTATFGGIQQDKFVFSKLGPEYGESFTLVWSDGNELVVPDSSRMTIIGSGNDLRKYQPGGRYSQNNSEIPSMEVYAKRGTHPDSVTLHY